MYDNWWNGGNRTTPQRHNMVGVLTEAASVKLATPIFLSKDDLRGNARGFADYRPATNFVDPWPGGWWRLRDILEYEKICARSYLTLAARYKDTFQRNYLAMGRDAIRQGQDEPPFAWIVPADQRDPGRAAEMVRILHDTGIEVHRASAPFQAGGLSYPAGSWILYAAQPYRTHLKDMMERQSYPARFTASGAAEAPYDVAGWTLPLQMGVRAVAIAEPFEASAERVERVERPHGGIEGVIRPNLYMIRNQADDDFLVLNALLAAGVEVRLTASAREDGAMLPAGALLLTPSNEARGVLDEVLPRVSTRVEGLDHPLPSDDSFPKGTMRLRSPRIGLYQPWVPSMDEGWTRLVLERYRFPYTTVHNAEIRAGKLDERFDVLLIPSIPSKTLRDGYQRDETEPSYVGGLGDEGADALRTFVRQGGTLICLEDSCLFAIETLKLPVADVIKNLKTSAFYCPGSLLRVRYTPAYPEGSWLTVGMPEEGSVYFDRSLGFEVRDAPAVTVAARYAASDLLESGWLLGPEKLQDKAALVEVAVGPGRVILFAFPPQHRGQTRGTFRLLFNALLRGGMTPRDKG
ncbi:MAG: hypothetical protein IRY99_10320 [Isosphaeraceae bacterium]|nr:hypothetical protein [Isosphaeraceae bacterium]